MATLDSNPGRVYALDMATRKHTHLTPVRFADGGPLRWMGGLPLPLAGTHYDGQVFPLSERVADVRAALDEQINGGLFCPPLAFEHVPMPVALGCVRRVRVLSQDEAAALGITQRHPHEVYFGCDITDPALAADYDAGRVLYGSPELRGDLVGVPWADETGRAWPLFVGEFSVVSIPHNKSQVPADRLRGVAMADKAGRVPMGAIDHVKAAMAALSALADALQGTDAAGTVEAALDAVEDTVAAAAEADIMGATEDVAPDLAELAEGAPEEDEPPAMRAMREEIASLRKAVAMRDAREAVGAAMRERAFAQKADDLVGLYLRDREAFRMLRDNTPKRPAASARQAGAPAPVSAEPVARDVKFAEGLRTRAVQAVERAKAEGRHLDLREAYASLVKGGEA